MGKLMNQKSYNCGPIDFLIRIIELFRFITFDKFEIDIRTIKVLLN